jgi:hypothetical protein
MRELSSSPYVRIRLEDGERIFRTVRSSEPFPSVADLVKSWTQVIETFDRIGRAGRCYLSDLRDGPARNDPEFERAMLSLLPRLHAGFLRNAVLVRLAVGALQIQRHARTDGQARLVTMDEAEALAYLRAAFVDGPQPPPARGKPSRPPK